MLLTDKQGIPLAISESIEGNHNDLFEIEILFTKMLKDVENAQISINGLFLNADAGFDGEALRKTRWAKDKIANIDFNKRNTKNSANQPLLDDSLYKERFSVERTNAWIDAFRALLIRFETEA